MSDSETSPSDKFCTAMREYLPKQIEKMLNKVKPCGVYHEFSKAGSLFIKMKLPNGKVAQLGFIQKNGQVWFTKPREESKLPPGARKHFLDKLAVHYGWQLKASDINEDTGINGGTGIKKEKYLKTPNVKLPKVTELVKEEGSPGFVAAVRSLRKHLRENQQADPK